MRKIFTFLLALATSVGMSWAQGPWTSGDCTVTLSGGVMTVSGNGAMADYNKSNPWKSYNSSITSIVIEDGVTHVGNGTFPQCTSLVSVVIGDDVETIGEFTFDDAGASLISVTMGNKVKSIGMAAFLWDTGLPELILSENLETIGDYAFCRMEALTTITIPSKVTSIGAAAFSNCSALQSIYIEATTPPTLGDGVFANVNANLSTIPLYVPSGSVAAYKAADQWNAFDIQGVDPTPSNVCGDGLTWEYNSTTNALTISYDGTGTGAMYDYDDEENYAPWISSYSESITSVIISNGVTSIGQGAFLRCQGLTSVTIPNSVTSIGGGAFMQCIGLTSVTIPNSVASIGQAAFAMCSNLETVTILAESLVSYGANAFYGTAEGLKIYVPAGSVDTYKAAWTAYADKIVAIPGGASEGTITVTWNSYDLPSSGSSFTKDGVTITCDIDDSDLYGPGTFTTDLGNFTKIEVTAYQACIIEATGGWSGNTDQMTWTGNAASVSWDGSIYGFSSDVTIVFTIEPSGTATAVENVQTNHVQAIKFFRDGQILILRDGKTYTVQGWQVR